MLILSIVSGALLAAQVLASSGLVARQVDVSDFPDQCQSNCSTYASAIGSVANNASCADTSCLCSDAIAKSYLGCSNCMISLNSSVQSRLQDNLNTYVKRCKDLGLPFSSSVNTQLPAPAAAKPSGAIAVTSSGVFAVVGIVSGLVAAVVGI